MNAFIAALAASSALLLSAGQGSAQDQLFRAVKAASGKAVGLGVVANVSRDCAPGPMPEVRVLTPPQNGVLSVRSRRLKAGAIARCPALEPTVRVVLYQSRASFAGADEVVYEIKLPNGSTQSVTARIEVSAQAPNPPAVETNDL